MAIYDKVYYVSVIKGGGGDPTICVGGNPTRQLKYPMTKHFIFILQQV